MDNVKALKDSQGFYSRLFKSIVELDGDGLANLQAFLDSCNFNNDIDVVFWLES